MILRYRGGIFFFLSSLTTPPPPPQKISEGILWAKHDSRAPLLLDTNITLFKNCPQKPNVVDTLKAGFHDLDPINILDGLILCYKGLFCAV